MGAKCSKTPATGKQGHGDHTEASKKERQAKIDKATLKYHLTPQEVAALKTEFDLLDLNKNGHVSTRELGKILSKLGREWTPEELADLIKQVDSDDDGFMEFDEFITMVKRTGLTTNKGRASVVDKPKKSCLLIIDMQNDFCPPNGSLAVKEGTDVIPVINDLRKKIKWDLIACTKDWHPADHISFHSNHKDDPQAELFKPYQLSNGNLQVLWPDHCVQNSKGADFHPDLQTAKTDLVVFKGRDRMVDSYSGFMDNDKKTKSELGPKLREAGITDVFVAGLAYDYCVGSSALDAADCGFRTYVVGDAARGVAEDTTSQMINLLKLKPVRIVQSSDVEAIVKSAAPVWTTPTS